MPKYKGNDGIFMIWSHDDPNCNHMKIIDCRNGKNAHNFGKLERFADKLAEIFDKCGDNKLTFTLREGVRGASTVIGLNQLKQGFKSPGHFIKQAKKLNPKSIIISGGVGGIIGTISGWTKCNSLSNDAVNIYNSIDVHEEKYSDDWINYI